MKRLKDEEKYFANLAGEIGPEIFRQAQSGAQEGILVIDVYMTGQRAVSELSFTIFNVKTSQLPPLVIMTIWGDKLVDEEAISWQRMEDITRAVAFVSRGFNITVLSVEVKEIKESSVHDSYSKAIRVGRVRKDVRDSGDDPLAKIVETNEGNKIFEGEIVSRTTEGKFAFT